MEFKFFKFPQYFLMEEKDILIQEAIKSFYFSLLQAIEACSRDLSCYQVVSWCGAVGYSTCSYDDETFEHDECGSALYQKGH